MKYIDEITDIENLALASSARFNFVPKTWLGQIFKKNIDWIKKNGYSLEVVVSSLVEILTLLSKGKGVITYYRVGQVVFKAIRNINAVRTKVFNRVNRYFVVPEFVDRRFYNKHKHNSMRFIDPRIVNILTFIREKTGRPVKLNTWYYGGHLQNRVLRPFYSKVGGKGSMHRMRSVGLCQAADFNVLGWSTKRVHTFIENNEKELYNLGLRRVEKAEATPKWTHIDLKEKNGAKGIYFFYP